MELCYTQYSVQYTDHWRNGVMLYTVFSPIHWPLEEWSYAIHSIQSNTLTTGGMELCYTKYSVQYTDHWRNGVMLCTLFSPIHWPLEEWSYAIHSIQSNTLTMGGMELCYTQYSVQYTDYWRNGVMLYTVFSPIHWPLEECSYAIHCIQSKSLTTGGIELCYYTVFSQIHCLYFTNSDGIKKLLHIFNSIKVSFILVLPVGSLSIALVSLPLDVQSNK